MSRARFWSAAILAPLAFAVATYWLIPYASLGLDGAGDRDRVWLLTLWTAGVMAICFGSAGILSSITPLGFRDVAEAGSLLAAREARREGHRNRSMGIYNFAGWTVIAGAMLLVIYFIAWLIGGR